jgi:hypothetical protein
VDAYLTASNPPGFQHHLPPAARTNLDPAGSHLTESLDSTWLLGTVQVDQSCGPDLGIGWVSHGLHLGVYAVPLKSNFDSDSRTWSLTPDPRKKSTIPWNDDPSPNRTGCPLEYSPPASTTPQIADAHQRYRPSFFFFSEATETSVSSSHLHNVPSLSSSISISNPSESNSYSRSLIQTDQDSWVSRSKTQPNLSNPDSETLR